MEETKAEDCIFSIHTHFYFLLRTDLPGSRGMWKDVVLLLLLCAPEILLRDISFHRLSRVSLLPHSVLSLLFTQQ